MKNYSAARLASQSFFRRLLLVGLLFPLASITAMAGSITWSGTDYMTSVRWGHTGTTLADGRVLAAGGFTRDPRVPGGEYSFSVRPTDSEEVYDPASGSWTPGVSMTTARAFHTATLLQDGTVLLAGGYNDLQLPLASAERYDPATGQFTPAGNMTRDRSYSLTLTLLPDGRVLAVGGETPICCTDAPLTETTADIYDPATNSWSAAGSFTPNVTSFETVLLQNGKVLVVSGATPISPFFTTQAELYDPASGTWTRTGDLLTGRSFFSATLLPGGKVLAAGGEGATGTLRSCELYDAATGKWTETASLHRYREHHHATLLADGRVLVACGVVGTVLPTYTQVAEVYDATRGAWQSGGKPLFDSKDFRQNLLPDGSVLVYGGLSDCGPFCVTGHAQLGVPGTP